MLLNGKQPFRVGEWTVEPELNSLRRGDLERRVEPKVMQVLVTLASRQNHVFSKSELISAVWPDTFVSDDVLTRCISILRRVTADDPQAPRFIQTVPKMGYRLLAPVAEEPAAPEDSQSTAASPVSAHPETDAWKAPDPLPPALAEMATLTQGSPAAPIAARPGRRNALLTAGIVLGLCACLALAGAWLYQARRGAGLKADTSELRQIPFTSYAGEQSEPAFSPDGRQIALVRTAEDGHSRRICIKPIGQETCRELTSAPGEQFSPTWSPDGHQIAFLSRNGDRDSLLLANAAGNGQPKQVYSPMEPSDWGRGALSWSPDGKDVIFPDHQNASPSSAILRLDLAAGRAVAITAPPPGWEGDLNPMYSPDGQRIAFTRASETAVRDLYWMSVRDGSVHQLTHARADINGIAWMPDGSGLVFSSNSSGQYALWRVGFKGQAPERLPVGTDNATQPALGPTPGQLAYTQGSAVWSIDKVGSDPVLTSTQEDSAPSISPSGRWFAFQSRRSGTQQIWVAAIDGSSLHQLTSGTGPMAGSPSWSHIGDQILFDARPAGHSHIFCISARGGAARQLTFGDANDIVPRWSNDDRAVYFRSNRGGRWQLWKLRLDGTPPVRITEGDGMAAQESPDGKVVYYTRGDEAGVWKVGATGGQELKVNADPPAGSWGYLHATEKGMLLLGRSRGKADLLLLDPATGKVRVLNSLPRQPPPYQGLSATPDGKVILLTGEREAERHITLVTGLP